ncbi:MAG: response regulator [Acidobacteriota bacterium]
MTTLTPMIRVLLVEDDPDYAAIVEQWLDVAGAGRKMALIRLDSLATAKTRLAEGDIDVVLLDLNLPDSRGIETFGALSAVQRHVPVIVLSSSDSEALAIETVRQGAENYLVKGVCTADSLVRALSYAVARRGRTLPTVRQPRVVGVVGVKGGTGCTTVACALAAALHRETNRSVLLADFDFDRGLVGFMAGLDPRYSLKDVIRNLDRLDRAVWTGLIANVDGVHVLPSGAVGGALQTEPSALSWVLGIAVGMYDWVVVDFGHIETYLKLKDQVSDVLLITTDGIPSLYLAKQCLAVIREQGVDDKHVSVVMNHTHPTFASPDDLRIVFGDGAYADVPHDERALRQALVERRLPAETSAFGSAVRTVARRLAGLEVLKTKRPTIFSRFNRKTPLAAIGSSSLDRR